MLIGVAVAAILGMLVIKWLLGYVQKHDLRVFLIYRLAFATLILLVWLGR